MVITILNLRGIKITDTSINNLGYCLSYSLADENFFRFKDWLSERERVKIDRIKNPLAKAESAMSRVLVKSLVNHYYLKESAIDYQKIEIVNRSVGDQAGSPEIYVQNKKIPLEVTMTHSCGHIAVWLCREPIGIDMEKVFLKKEWSFIKDVFTSIELDRLLRIKSYKNLEEGITVLWCIKESLSKLLKCGLQFKPQFIQVLMNRDQTVDIHFAQQLEAYFHLFNNKELRLNVQLSDNFCNCKNILLLGGSDDRDYQGKSADEDVW